MLVARSCLYASKQAVSDDCGQRLPAAVSQPGGAPHDNEPSLAAFVAAAHFHALRWACVPSGADARPTALAPARGIATASRLADEAQIQNHVANQGLDAAGFAAGPRLFAAKGRRRLGLLRYVQLSLLSRACLPYGPLASWHCY